LNRNFRMGNKKALTVLVALILVSLLLAACGSTANTPAATKPTTATAAQNRDISEIDAITNELLTTNEIPGVAIGIIKDGKIVQSKGYGVKNIQTKQPVTADTQFQLASITKTFLSLAIAQQVEAGKISWDTPVITYAPDIKLADANATKKLTLRHLISHTSGLADWAELLKSGSTPAQVIKEVATVKLAAEPGQKWEYANVNYVLAAHALEKATGKSWQTLVQELTFEPLGMKNASFSSDVMQKKPDYAAPHAFDVLVGTKIAPYSKGIEALAPAGIINASLNEMLQYSLMQLKGGIAPGSGKPVIGQSYLAETYKQQSPINDVPTQPELINTKGYALGWINEEYKGQKIISHNGGIDGFHTYLTLFPESKSAVLILVNAESQDINTAIFMQILRNRLVEWLLGQPLDPKVVSLTQQAAQFNPTEFNRNLQAARTFKPELNTLKKLEGEYTGQIGKLVVTVKEAKLNVQVPTSEIVELIPFSNTEFMANTRGITGQVFSFKPDKDGQLKIYQMGFEIAKKN
jgi:CubicO group peptidase (beta-lactamase class C family)